MTPIKTIGAPLLGILSLVAFGAVIPGCTVYEVAPGTYVSQPPSTFDRSWSAALGALDDQGVSITHQDRSSGQIRGTRNGTDVRADLRTQADGSVRVEFHTASRDGLAERISQSYNRRMGR